MDISLKHEDCKLLESFIENISEECVEADFSMPEYMPEILRIIKSVAEPKINSCRVTGDRATIDGTCLLKMIYTAEDGGVYSFSQERNFTRYCENAEFSQCTDSIARVSVSYVNCRATSTKRAEIKAGLNISVVGYTVKTQDIIAIADKTDIEEKCMPVRCASLGCRKTRSFAMSDTITLNVPSAFVISSRAVAVCNDIRKINNKIMLKGEAIVDICYVNADDKSQTERIKHNLPINQILEFDGLEERFSGEVILNVCAVDVIQKNENDGRGTSFDISLGVDASATMWEEKELLVITDAYSVGSCIDLKKTNYSFLCSPEYIKDTYIHKEELSLSGANISDIVDVTGDITRCDVKCENSSIVFYGSVSVSVLTRDLSGNIVNYNKLIDYRYEKKSEDYCSNTKCSPDVKLLSLDYMKKSENCIDLRFEFKICGEVFQCLFLDAVTDITESEIQVKKERNAITVYFPEKEESLWSIARKYNTTVNAIAQENDLSGETTEDLKIVFIPAV